MATEVSAAATNATAAAAAAPADAECVFADAWNTYYQYYHHQRLNDDSIRKRAFAIAELSVMCTAIRRFSDKLRGASSDYIPVLTKARDKFVKRKDALVSERCFTIFSVDSDCTARDRIKVDKIFSLACYQYVNARGPDNAQEYLELISVQILSLLRRVAPGYFSGIQPRRCKS